ncbi:gp53-like domain-containing protein [Parasutterella excrementihominis]|jgi:hypothetical protein|uniref:gp53-like domain-containing protein n=2 Tax=Parasutterella excrementihominis TaxID=487175 RepID=UPI00272A226B|nr:hypothetical protein [Parasutterella excrementihominis]
MAQTVEAKQVVLKDSEGGYLLPYAGVAQKALKDNDGNDIPTTYAKRADLNGYLPVDGKAVDSAKADTATSAASATKATQDSAGQQINTTYIKNVSVNGRTITFTRGDGTTFTITTQDTVTTNSSNWSVSNGTNGWARDNSTGFTIQWGTGVNFSSSTIYITLPRTFTAFRSVVAVPGNTHGYGGIRANINSNSNIRMYSNSTGDGENTSWVALGFT